MECFALLAGRDSTLLPGAEPCGHVQMEAMRFILTPTGGLKDIVEDGLIDLWTDGKMTVEELVE